MNKSAAFEAGVVAALEKEAWFGPFKKKEPVKVVAKKVRGAFGGHAKEMAKALSEKKNAREVVSRKVLDAATGKYRVVRHINL